MLERYRRSRFVRSTLELLSGTVVARLVSLLSAPVLARLYLPEDFAALALLTSATAILGVVATLRYEMAVVLARDDAEAGRVVSLILLLGLAVGLLLALLVAPLAEVLERIVGLDLGGLVYLLPAYAVIAATQGALANWAIRKCLFRVSAATDVVIAVVTLAVSFVLGWTALHPHGLIAGFFAGQLAGLFFLVAGVRAQGGLVLYLDGGLWRCAGRYRNFPAYNLPNALLDGVRVAWTNLMIARCWGANALGHYAFAWRFLWMPISLVGGAAGKVLFQRLSEAKAAGVPLRPSVVKFLVHLVGLGAVPFLVIAIWSPGLFALVFGPAWREAGDVARILSPWLFLNFLSSSLSVVYVVLERQRALLVLGLAYTLAPVAVLHWSGDTPLLDAMGRLGLVMSGLLVLMIAQAVRLAGRHDQSVERDH